MYKHFEVCIYFNLHNKQTINIFNQVHFSLSGIILITDVKIHYISISISYFLFQNYIKAFQVLREISGKNLNILNMH